LRVIGLFVKQVGNALCMLYDAVIFVPLLIERMVVGSRRPKAGGALPDVAPFAKRLSEIERSTTREHG
jgi:hypothetical protein